MPQTYRESTEVNSKAYFPPLSISTCSCVHDWVFSFAISQSFCNPVKISIRILLHNIEINFKKCPYCYCVKSARKIRTRITPNTDNFYA